jgi:Fur family ferric uptake transcriptional regulator
MPHCQETIAELRTRGYRITPQREMIIEAVAHHTSHLTADELFNLVQDRSKALNRATVYRTLELLVEEGLVSRSDFGQGEMVYAPVEHGPHLHLVCRQCGNVTAADHNIADPLCETLLEKHAFHAECGHLAIFGLCSNCQKENPAHAS